MCFIQKSTKKDWIAGEAYVYPLLDDDEVCSVLDEHADFGFLSCYFTEIAVCG